ncbi:HNH endonuclease [Pseudanabaena sp. FACHB-1277]|uniref:HNH endonuclease n=1 Tax=Pseudanabaena cinerea FACHB-1277 TaxID=2949581 RepID=A0A926UPI1_9CYAN|nr:HNH endonuclease [Pseudanabaena cinerea]MBD2148679.1 HNH endonuclease [Pseudanabaena cinerea FACHB-1277]
MAIIHPSTVNEIEFDKQDIEVFKIPDVKERIAALQNHFFPRLELLVKDSVELIKGIYGVVPYERMTDVYTPSNRTNAATNKLHGLVHVGLSGKRRSSKKDQPLAIKNASGKQIYIHPAYLTFDVLSQGCIRVVFQPFSTSVEPSFVSKVRQEMQSNIEMINTLFSDFEIYYNSNIAENSDDFYKLIDTKRFGLPDGKDIHSLYFCTGAYFFPANFENELWNLKLAFVCLYPLLDLFISIGDGREPRLAEMLNKFNEWISENQDETEGLDEYTDQLINLPVESLEEIAIDRENIESKLDFNPENLTDARERTNRAIVQRQGQPKFRSDLLKAYGGKCAITDCDAESALEAAHIFSYLGADTNHVTNGLLLRADIHTLFDLYLISIDPDTSKVVVSSSLLNTCYKELNGKPLKSPRDYASPSPEAIASHYEKFSRNQNNS